MMLYNLVNNFRQNQHGENISFFYIKHILMDLSETLEARSEPSQASNDNFAKIVYVF